MLWTEVGIIIALTVLNGCFSGAEIALLALRKTRLQELAEEGSSSAAAALRLRRDPERLLATVQVGITVIGASTAVFGGAHFEEPLVAWLTSVGLGRFARQLTFFVVVGGVSYLSLVIGELVPKSLALQRAERFALPLARPLELLSIGAKPLVSLLTGSSNLVLGLFRDTTNFSEAKLSPDEVQQLVEESGTVGALHTSAAEIASRAIDLGRLRANALMVPRMRIVSLAIDAPTQTVLQILSEHPHARYPVTGKSTEEVLGYVLAHEVLQAIAEGRGPSLRRLKRPVSYFPATVLAVDVLRALQSKRTQLALLVDESGGIEGLVTIEDIAEEVLGEILDENEVVRPLTWIDNTDGSKSVIALGEAPLHEVERMLDEDLNETRADVTTIAGLITAEAGHVPDVGDRVQDGPDEMAEVLEANDRVVLRARLRRAVEPDEKPTEV